jgi:hypothetical protein
VDYRAYPAKCGYTDSNRNAKSNTDTQFNRNAYSDSDT